VWSGLTNNAADWPALVCKADSCAASQLHVVPWLLSVPPVTLAAVELLRLHHELYQRSAPPLVHSVVATPDWDFAPQHRHSRQPCRVLVLPSRITFDTASNQQG
jgi:hypothetical protein